MGYLSAGLVPGCYAFQCTWRCCCLHRLAHLQNVSQTRLSRVSHEDLWRPGSESVRQRFQMGVDVLQSLQLLCNVAVIILSNGQGLSQIYSPLCFSVWCIIFMLAGILLGQIRGLSNFSYIANAAIWMNLFVVFSTMGIAGTKPPIMLEEPSKMVCPTPPTLCELEPLKMYPSRPSSTPS